MTDYANPPSGFNPDTAPRFGLNAQYTKDLSFEHPMAPRTFSMEGAPQISVNVGTQAERVSDNLFEVTLRILCEAKHGEETAFVVDLYYAGLFTLANIPPEHVEPCCWSRHRACCSRLPAASLPMPPATAACRH